MLRLYWQCIAYKISLCVLLVSSTATAAEDDTLRARIDVLAAPYLENNIVMGMVIGVSHHGETHVFGCGRLSAENPQPPNGETVFEIGSISKVFTGVLLADAVNQGRLKLDQPAQELLPPDVTMPTHEHGVITLQDLSTHVSGLPRLPQPFQPADSNNPYADYTVEQMYDFLKGHKLRRAPGEKGEYSNLAVGLLGHLLARNADQSYEQLLVSRIAKPLKMNDTSITLNSKQQTRLAPPHTADLSKASNWDIPTFAGAGAIRSTTNDMLRFAEAQLNPPEGPLGKAVELAWQVHQPPLAASDFSMGLGWHLARDGTTHWHNGQTGGYHSMLFVSRPLKTAVVLLTNTATGEVDQLAEQIVRALAGSDEQPRKFDKSVEVASAVMQRYVGNYELAPGVVFTVTVKDDRLMVGLTGQPTFQVFARSETEWFYKVVEAAITFQVDEQGKCESLELFQNGIRQTARRVAE